MENNLKKSRGQFFTTKKKVLDVLISLIKNNGNILEPSAGEGHIVKQIEDYLNKDVISVELDLDKISSKICRGEIVNDNFFNFIKTSNKFNTIIGNPPFVKLKNVENETVKLLPEKIPGNGNLYYYFIKYCVNLLNDGGELVFIVPKEWLYNVSAQFVRDFLKDNGGFTHFIDCGEEKLFDDADVPALCIFRYEKDYTGKVNYYKSINDYHSDLYDKIDVKYSNTISFTDENYVGKIISDFFYVKVGIVSGAEKIFKKPNFLEFNNNSMIKIMGTDKQLIEYIFVDSYTVFENIPKNVKDYLLPYKDKLISRKISKFTENNWWKYGAVRNFKLMVSDSKRIYGLMKTRKDDIFWVGNSNEFFGGGLIGLFPKEGVNLDLEKVVNFLNSEEFKKIMKENNLYSNDKVSITPSVFSGLPFPYFM